MTLMTYHNVIQFLRYNAIGQCHSYFLLCHTCTCSFVDINVMIEFAVINDIKIFKEFQGTLTLITKIYVKNFMALMPCRMRTAPKLGISRAKLLT